MHLLTVITYRFVSKHTVIIEISYIDTIHSIYNGNKNFDITGDLTS